MKSDRGGDIFTVSRLGSDDDDYLGFAGKKGDFRSLSQLRRLRGAYVDGNRSQSPDGSLQSETSFVGRDSNVDIDYSQSAPYTDSVLRSALARSGEVVNSSGNPYAKGSGSEYNGSLDDVEIARLIKSEKQARRELEALKGMKDNSQEFIDKSAEKNVAEELYKARKKFMKLITPITAPARFGFNLASIGTLMSRSFGIGINNKIEIREDGEKKSYAIRELLAQDENGKPKYESLPADTMEKISQKIESKQKTRNTATSFAFGLLAIATFAVGIASFATGLAPIGIAMGALGGAMFAGFMGLNAVKIAKQKRSGIKEDLENASKQIVADGVNLAKTKEEVQELAAKDKMARYSPRNTMHEKSESAIRPEAKNSMQLSHVDRLSNSKTLSNEKSARVAERW